jgi:hypothetical protein
MSNGGALGTVGKDYEFPLKEDGISIIHHLQMFVRQLQWREVQGLSH